MDQQWNKRRTYQEIKKANKTTNKQQPKKKTAALLKIETGLPECQVIISDHWATEENTENFIENIVFRAFSPLILPVNAVQCWSRRIKREFKDVSRKISRFLIGKKPNLNAYNRLWRTYGPTEPIKLTCREVTQICSYLGCHFSTVKIHR